MTVTVEEPIGEADAPRPARGVVPLQSQGQLPSAHVFRRTYAVLRWSMPVLLLWLLVAMAWVWFQVWRADDMAYPMTSISAYYYTDAKTVFVGVLMMLGVLLIVIQGRTPWEDALMNTAGALAPFVALLPTPVDGAKDCAEAYCTSVILLEGLPKEVVDPVSGAITRTAIPDNHELIAFNIVAVIPIWVILVVYLGHLARRARIARDMQEPELERELDDLRTTPDSDRDEGWRERFERADTARRAARSERRATWACAFAVLAFGLAALGVWFLGDRGVFYRSAHLASAGTMVALLLASIVPFAGWARPSTYGFFRWTFLGRRPFAFLRNGFGVFLAVALALLGVCVGIIVLKPDDWNHKVLVIEAAALVPFSVYWIMQGFALRIHDKHA